MRCFARRGFHQCTIQDISIEAGISVGLIYRYFANKDEVITYMADEQRRDLEALLERARMAASLQEALETFFTGPCCEAAGDCPESLIVDLFAEAGRNPDMKQIVGSVLEWVTQAVVDLIERSPEAANLPAGLSARQVAELLIAVHDGLLMREVVSKSAPSAAANAARIERQVEHVRRLCGLLFPAGGRTATSDTTDLMARSKRRKK